MWWQFYFKPGTNVKKAAASISSIANKNALRPHNLLWQDKAQFEHEVGLLQRFLVDAPVSGGVSHIFSCSFLGWYYVVL